MANIFIILHNMQMLQIVMDLLLPNGLFTSLEEILCAKQYLQWWNEILTLTLVYVTFFLH